MNLDNCYFSQSEYAKVIFLWTVVRTLGIETSDFTDAELSKNGDVYLHSLFIKNIRLVIKKDSDLKREDVIVHYEDENTGEEYWSSLANFNSNADIEQWINKLEPSETY